MTSPQTQDPQLPSAYFRERKATYMVDAVTERGVEVAVKVDVTYQVRRGHGQTVYEQVGTDVGRYHVKPFVTTTVRDLVAGKTVKKTQSGSTIPGLEQGLVDRVAAESPDTISVDVTAVKVYT